MSKHVDSRDLNVCELNIAQPIVGDLKTALEHIARELLDGVHHGFSKMNIAVEKVQANKTSITVESGKSFRFIC